MNLPNPSPRQVDEIRAAVADLPEDQRLIAVVEFWRRVRADHPGLAADALGHQSIDPTGRLFAGYLNALMLIEACLEARKEE